MHTPERVVEKLLRAGGEGPERLRRRIVPGVRLGDGKAPRQRAARGRDPSRRVERFAGIPAIAEHVEPAVPFSWQAHLEAHLGLNLPRDAAVLGRVGRRRNHRRPGHGELVAGQRYERCTGGAGPHVCGVAKRRRLPVLELRPVLRRQRRTGGCENDRHQTSETGGRAFQASQSTRLPHTNLPDSRRRLRERSRIHPAAATCRHAKSISRSRRCLQSARCQAEGRSLCSPTMASCRPSGRPR